MQRAHRSRVMIVSPTLMVMAIQVIKQVRKDAQMREAVGLIQRETGHLMNDVRLLWERVNKLKTHFGQASTDVDQILTSAGKIEKRAGRIEELEFDGEPRANCRCRWKSPAGCAPRSDLSSFPAAAGKDEGAIAVMAAIKPCMTSAYRRPRRVAASPTLSRSICARGC